MKIKTWVFKLVTILTISLLLLSPELAPLTLFIDTIGLDLFFLLIEVQIVAVIGNLLNIWFKPILMPIYKYLLKFDPYFFIPTKDSVYKYPMILCHAVPFMMLLIIGATVAKPIIDMT